MRFLHCATLLALALPFSGCAQQLEQSSQQSGAEDPSSRPATLFEGKAEMRTTMPAAADQMAMDGPMDRAMPMQGMFGRYPMRREASGTSWQPDATPDADLHWDADQWMLMMHGSIADVLDHQGGPSGGQKNFSESMLMLMAQRPTDAGTFGLETMLSLDPLMGKAGYPLLFASGETADGKIPLINRQHPHDLVMELAASDSLELSSHSSVFGYLGWPGEPALGPPSFMERFSGANNPEAPISHHWLDSTHITEGVLTLGATLDDLRLEASAFNGREPDQFRYRIETGALDSSSMRISWNPDAAWSLQASVGSLVSPEQLAPEVNVVRRTASAIYQSTWAGAPWGTTFAYGQDRRSSGTSTGAWLLESTVQIAPRYTLFGRAEHMANDQLFAPGTPLADRVFHVSKVSLGAIDDVARLGPSVIGVGALVSRYAHDAELDRLYGHPSAWMVFIRAKLGP